MTEVEQFIKKANFIKPKRNRVSINDFPAVPDFSPLDTSDVDEEHPKIVEEENGNNGVGLDNTDQNDEDFRPGIEARAETLRRVQ